MLTLKFSTSSWHYKLATFGGYSDWSTRSRNICAYLRRIVAGIVKGILLGALSLAIVSLMLYGLYSFVVHFHGLRHVNELAAIGILLDAIVLVIGSLGIFFQLKETYGWKFGSKVPAAPPKPSFIAEAYRSWADKTCVQLEFESTESKVDAFTKAWPRYDE